MKLSNQFHKSLCFTFSYIYLLLYIIFYNTISETNKVYFGLFVLFVIVINFYGLYSKQMWGTSCECEAEE